MREERGLTQEALRDELRKLGGPVANLSQPTVSAWETGTVPGLLTAAVLADFYGVALPWLAREEGEKKPRPVGEAELILAEVRALVTGARKPAEPPQEGEATPAQLEEAAERQRQISEEDQKKGGTVPGKKVANQQ